MKDGRTKIVATIGPISGNEEMLKKLVEAGADVFRFNFSHGEYAIFEVWTNLIRKISGEIGKPLGILADLQGPRIRVGVLPDAGVDVIDGQEVFVGYNISGTDIIPIDYQYLLADIKTGSRILLVDGLIELEALEVLTDRVKCKVLQGGKILSHKGVNIPGTPLSIESITEKDKRDLDWMVDHDIDWVGLSFVRSSEDIKALKKLISTRKATSKIKVIAKIEKQEALDQLQEILEVADGVMVARGDLGIELPAQAVPVAQKSIISQALEIGKPVITATQMLESMIVNPRPTRAEVSDIANAVLDGTDAIMLSGETATGKFPVESVAVMSKIVSQIEIEVFETKSLKLGQFAEAEIEELKIGKELLRPVDAVGSATCELADHLQAKLIIIATLSGNSALMVAKHRPKTKLVLVTPDHAVWRQMSLVWGLEPLIMGNFHTTDELIFQAVDIVSNKGYVAHGDLIVLTAGHPVGKTSQTNLIKLHVVE